MGCFQSKVISEFKVPRKIRRVGPRFTIYDKTGESITHCHEGGFTYSSNGNPRPDE